MVKISLWQHWKMIERKLQISGENCFDPKILNLTQLSKVIIHRLSEGTTQEGTSIKENKNEYKTKKRHGIQETVI